LYFKVAGHPRNNLMTGKTFMTVEVKEANDTWTTIRTDAHFDTLYTHDFYGYYTFD
jgi:neutral ceramidase